MHGRKNNYGYGHDKYTMALFALCVPAAVSHLGPSDTLDLDIIARTFRPQSHLGPEHLGHNHT